MCMDGAEDQMQTFAEAVWLAAAIVCGHWTRQGYPGGEEVISCCQSQKGHLIPHWMSEAEEWEDSRMTSKFPAWENVQDTRVD